MADRGVGGMHRKDGRGPKALPSRRTVSMKCPSRNPRWPLRRRAARSATNPDAPVIGLALRACRLRFR